MLAGSRPARSAAVAHAPDQRGQPVGVALAREVAVGETHGALDRGFRVAADEDRDRALHRARTAGDGWEVDELAVELGVRPVPQGTHGGDVLVVARPASFPRHAEGVELLLHPADAEPQLDASAGEAIERRQFLGQHHGIALGDDEDAGAETQRRCRRGGERQPDQWVGDRRLRFRRDLAVDGVRVPRLDGGGEDDVLPTPHRLEAGRLGATAQVDRGVTLDRDAAGEGKSEAHVSRRRSLGIQLPWNPLGMRGRSTEAIGSGSIVAASRTTKRLVSVSASWTNVIR